MDTKQFFKKLLPDSGLKALFIINNNGIQVTRRHIYLEETDELAEIAQHLDSTTPQTVYFALASFKEAKQKGGRTHDNASHVKAFWLDVDCGEGKDYISQSEGAKALVKFLKEARLPKPMIVSSGHGLHVYWPLTQELGAQTWTKVAHLLKGITQHFKFKADNVRTADVSSVLRPIGTHNKKKGKVIPVTLLKDTAPVNTKDFVSHIVSLSKQFNIKTVDITKREPATHADSLNASLLSKPDYPESDANIVADKCMQLAHMRDTRGNIEEPLWYSCLGVIRYCTDSEVVAHEWSKGHESYSEAETNRKLAQLSKVNPTTCARFEALSDSLCHGCKYKGKITSPIQLGVHIEALPDPVDHTETGTLEAPQGFRRAKDGIYAIVDDIPIRIFDRDIYPVRIVYDEHQGFEEVVLRYDKPVEGLQEFKVRTASFCDLKKTSESLYDNGVIVPEMENRKKMGLYITNYVKGLQKKSATLKLYGNMGWKDDFTKFVLGSHIINSEGEITRVGISQTIKKSVAEAVHPKGDMAEWVDLTRELGKSGMEPHAFTLLCGFGAPLMPLTGLEAILVNMVGSSGTGKSTMQRFVNSIYGDVRKLAASHEDTDNAKFARAAMLSNLPVTIDEITNIEPMALSSFVYRVTQGRDRSRLKRDGTEREHVGEWNTILISSSNQSLMSKLAHAKINTEAETMRVFEYDVPMSESFSEWWGKKAATVIRTSYGHVGQEYIRTLVRNASRHADLLEKMTLRLEEIFGLKPQERYWSALIGCTFYGGSIAKKLGLIDFDINSLIPWMKTQIAYMRSSLNENTLEPVDLLAQYLINNIDKRIIINEDGTNIIRGLTSTYDKEPVRELHIRMETHTNRLYIDRAHFSKYVADKGTDYSHIKKGLTELGVMLDARRYYLGKGTSITTPQTWCIVLDASHPLMSGMMVKVIDNSVQQVR